MENEKFKRSFRRYKKQVKTLQRAFKWYSTIDSFVFQDKKSLRRGSSKTWAKFKREVEDGRYMVFLRHTACPCNCYMCSGDNKYKRKHDWKKELSSLQD